MSKRYVYKNVNKRTVNIGGFQFKEGQKLESDVWISGFNEAVSNGFLDLIEQDEEEAGRDATQAQQTGDTGKVKVIFHLGFDAEGEEVLKEVEIAPNTPIEFPSFNLKEGETSGSWFKDANFAKPVNVDKAKAPKEGELHFYAKYKTEQKEIKPDEQNEPPKPNEDN